ncbi:hypothetical protein [Halomontanus rarus]
MTGSTGNQSDDHEDEDENENENDAESGRLDKVLDIGLELLDLLLP